MQYRAKKASKSVSSKIARRKKTRYHNDTALFATKNGSKRKKVLRKLVYLLAFIYLLVPTTVHADVNEMNWYIRLHY